MERLTGVQLRINNEALEYVNGTLKADDGHAEFVVENLVVGGDQFATIFGEKLDTKIGKVMVDIPTTEANIALVADLKSRRDQNQIKLLAPSGRNYTAVFSRAILINKPENDYSEEGNMSLEFQTQPSV